MRQENTREVLTAPGNGKCFVWISRYYYEPRYFSLSKSALEELVQ